MRTQTLLVFLLLAASPLTPQPTERPRRPPVTKKESARGTQPENAPQEKQKTATKESTAKEISSPRPNANATDSKAAEELATNRWIARFTGVLALVGLLQFVALIIQAKIFHQTLEENRSLIAAATQSANAAHQSAVATQQYGQTTVESNTITRESNHITREVAELTRQSIALTHRPKLIVRNVAMDSEEGIFKWRTGSTGGNPVPLNGTLCVVNVGNSAAHVTAWQCQVLIAAQLPTRSPLPLLTAQLPNPITLPSGVYGTIPFSNSPRADITSDELFALWKQEVSLYVLGEVVYEDDVKNIRTTWFCRRGLYGSAKLVPEQDSDYERAD